MEFYFLIPARNDLRITKHNITHLPAATLHELVRDVGSFVVILLDSLSIGAIEIRSRSLLRTGCRGITRLSTKSRFCCVLSNVKSRETEQSNFFKEDVDNRRPSLPLMLVISMP